MSHSNSGRPRETSELNPPHQRMVKSPTKNPAKPERIIRMPKKGVMMVWVRVRVGLRVRLRLRLITGKGRTGRVGLGVEVIGFQSVPPNKLRIRSGSESEQIQLPTAPASDCAAFFAQRDAVGVSFVL